ncbi:protein AHNAK2-like isoform X2 [Xenia sp. Carnegie-2017]|uniref:protein AHNAK2-like isoform X2 n=1 Tax=Xenia sp. Carnegie-2017 TaxID=2897299 RepID=UPI001F03AE63|nr:protein AHNAK2-like isoform X2 [Xenia sp. Carnegie-2017]
MSVEEKRVHYRCGRDYVMLESISPWPDYVDEKQPKFVKKESVTEDDVLNKVSLWRGDITRLEIDAIVNAANTRLLGGGGVDGCIHRAAGKCLYEECYTLNGCETGKAKITSGYKLPAKYVIHTVGPMGENKLLLKSCYESCLSIVKEKKLESVAFCCISTGIYGYPIENATDVALMTVKDWLENNKSWAGRIIFCVFSKDDLYVYEKKMLKYFPFTKKTNEQMNVDNDGSRAEIDTGSKSNDKDETRRPSLSNKSEVLTNELSMVKGKTSETNILKEKGNKRLESEKEDERQPYTMDMTSGKKFTNMNFPEEGHGGKSDVMEAASVKMTDAGSGSETSDGKSEGLKRKLELPSGGIGISGGLKGSKGDSDSSGSETSDGKGGRIKRKLKSPNVDIKAKASADKDKDGKSGFNLPKFHMPKFGFGGSGKSKGKSSKKGKKKGFEMEGDVKLPSGEVEGDIPKVSIDTDLQNEPPSLSYSGSDTSDGHGGRIKRKLKLPSGDINISGGLKGPKGDADSSDSDTSDGKGGRTKRKVKTRSSTEDAKYSSSISPKRMKFKLPKFGLGASKKEKNAEIVKEVDSLSEDQLVLDKFEIPNFDIDVKTVSSGASKEFKIDLEQKPAPVVISASQENPVFTGPTRQSSVSGDLISSTDISMNADISGESVSPHGSTIVCDEKCTRTSRVLPDLQYDVDYGDIDFGDVDSDFQHPLSQIESNISVSSEGGGLYSAPSGGIYADFDKNNDGEEERKIHQKPSGPLVFEDITRSSRDKPDISHDVDFSTFDFDVPSIQVKQYYAGKKFTNMNFPEEGHGGESDVVDAASEEMTDAGQAN